MEFLKILRNSILIFSKKIKQFIVINKYNRFTIADYFRKQGAQIGIGCSIIPRSLGDEPYLVKIGNGVTIAKGVTFLTHDGGCWVFREEIPDLQVFGTIVIEDNCVIGQNVVLIPNIRIGENSIIGAGSVVISDIPPNSIAMGVPARVFGSLKRYRENCIARWNLQKPPDCVIEEGHNWWNSENYKENRKKLKHHLINLFWKQDQDKENKEE